jgi:hypothetical protein
MEVAAPGQATPALEVLAAIEADFQGWHAWGSNAGRWWATRTEGTAAWKAAGLPMTVDADDEAGLRAELAGLAALS